MGAFVSDVDFKVNSTLTTRSRNVSKRQSTPKENATSRPGSLRELPPSNTLA